MNSNSDLNLSQLSSLINTRRKLVMAVVMVAAAGLIGVFLAFPQGKLIYSNYQQLEKDKQQLTKLQGKIQQLEQLQTSGSFEDFQILDEALPSKKPLLELLSNVTVLVGTTGVKINDFEISPGLIASNSAELAASQTRRSQTGYDTLGLELSITGSFDQARQFMVLLEQITPFTSIKAFTMSEQGTSVVSGKPSDADQVRIKLTTDTYFFTETVETSLERPLARLNAQDEALMAELQLFQVSSLAKQTDIQGGVEDLFGIAGWEQFIKQ